MLSSGAKKLSSDLLQRVQASVPENCISGPTPSVINRVKKEEKTFIGDWCVFKLPRDKNLKVGRILAFSYLTGKGRSCDYSALSAPVSFKNISTKNTKKKKSS